MFLFHLYYQNVFDHYNSAFRKQGGRRKRSVNKKDNTGEKGNITKYQSY